MLVVKPFLQRSNPRAIFERFFNAGDRDALIQQRKRLVEGRKVVDMVMADANSLNKNLGKNDKGQTQWSTSTLSVKSKTASKEPKHGLIFR